MLSRVLAAGTIVLACACIQQWSNGRRRDQQQLRQVDIPRWEDEGGSPPSDPLQEPAIRQQDITT
jgi:hypothetical protein